MLEKIKFKNHREIEMMDINQLTPHQLESIRKKSVSKTLAEWRSPKNKETVKLPITKQQKQEVIDTKNYIIRGRTAKELLLDDIFFITEHFEKRGAWRIEGKDPDSPMSVKTKLEVVKIFMEAKINDITDEAEWKGYPYLSYNFKGEINNKEVTISFAFGDQIIWVTIIDHTDNKPDYGTPLIEKLPLSMQEILKSFK